MKVGVIGGGPAGLLSSAVLARDGYDVILFEEHSSVGVPRHCTGLISEEVAKEIARLSGGISSDWIVQEFRGYNVMSVKGGEGLHLRFNERVFVTDRVRMEMEMQEVAESSGVTIRLGTHVDTVLPSGVLIAKGTTLKYDALVLAEGAVLRHSMKNGLCQTNNRLLGIQALAYGGEGLEEPIVFVGKELSKHFFGWAVPYGNRLIIGLADRHARLEGLWRIISLLRKRLDVKVSGVERYFGGFIPINNDCLPGKARLVAIGDSLGTVKPLSGGGLYLIVKEVNALKKSFSGGLDLGRYVNLLSGVWKLVRRHALLRRLIFTVGGYEAVLRWLSGAGIEEIPIRRYDELVIDLSALLRSFFNKML